MSRERLKTLTDKFVKADKFYASDASEEKKEKFRPALNKLVDELGELYCKLKKEGKASPEDLPSYSYSMAKTMFNGRDHYGVNRKNDAL